MSKKELVKTLVEFNSEYLYQDIGYGSFKNENEFIIQGKVIPVSKITKNELEVMLNSYGF